MIQLIKEKVKGLDEHTIEVVKKSLASGFVKMSGVLVALFISIYLGRTIGAEGLGIIDLANRIVVIALVFTVFGMDRVLVKNLAIAYHDNNFKAVSDYLGTSTRINGVFATAIAILLFYCASYISDELLYMPKLAEPLKIAAVMVIPQTFSRIFASALNGFGKIWQSNLVNETLSSWVVGIGLIAISFASIEIDVVDVAVLYAIARIVVLSIIFLYWKRLYHAKGVFSWRLSQVLKSASVLFLVSGTSVIATNVDSIMLGWLTDATEVGVYSVALKLATFMVFFLHVTNSAISPKLATLFAKNRKNEMQVMVHRVTLGLMLVAVLFILIFILGGPYLLTFWGSIKFQEAYWVLIILCMGQFINISTGCAGMLLIMCGFEKLQGYISFNSVLINIILNYFFIKFYGAQGAAIATSVTIALENTIKVFLARKYVGISTIPFLKMKIL